MRWMAVGAVGLVLAFAGPLAQAQDNPGSDVSEIVVTASRLREYDPVQTPFTALRKRADNLITEVKVVCDTRDLSQRKAELKATLRSMIKAAAGANIELGLGDEVIGRFDETMLDAVITPDTKADTSVAILVVKTRVAPADSFDSATGRIEAFIDKTPKAGRTEILRTGDWNLTLIGPQRYRPDVIALISVDAHKTAAAFGPEYGVGVDGLQLPLSWYQSGPLELALYIPYRLNVSPMRK